MESYPEWKEYEQNKFDLENLKDMDKLNTSSEIDAVVLHEYFTLNSRVTATIWWKSWTHSLIRIIFYCQTEMKGIKLYDM